MFLSLSLSLRLSVYLSIYLSISHCLTPGVSKIALVIQRPRETLRRTILREAKSMRLNIIQHTKDLAVQRPKWRAMVTALCAAHGPGGL
jgi:hypothetical protein